MLLLTVDEKWCLLLLLLVLITGVAGGELAMIINICRISSGCDGTVVKWNGHNSTYGTCRQGICSYWEYSIVVLLVFQALILESLYLKL